MERLEVTPRRGKMANVLKSNKPSEVLLNMSQLGQDTHLPQTIALRPAEACSNAA